MRLFKYNVVLLLGLILLQSLEKPVCAQSSDSKIYVLFVWGTLEPDTRAMTVLSANKLLSAFSKSNDQYAQIAEKEHLPNTAGTLSAISQYVAEVKSLDGENATGLNILKECVRLSAEAGPNDAVMVYILCHGGVIRGADGKERHGLSPVATSRSDLNMKNIGIARGTIMKAITSNKHRLNLLITDSCSEPIVEEFENIEDDFVGVGRPVVRDYYPYLVAFLLKARGDLNINSSRPQTVNKGHELARGFMYPKWENVPSEKEERANYEQYGGTVFLNAFLNVAAQNALTKSVEDFTVDVFFENLRDALDKQYHDVMSFMIKENLVDVSKFMDQDTQTLTRYDDDSIAFPEDLLYESHYKVDNGGSLDDDEKEEDDVTF